MSLHETFLAPLAQNQVVTGLSFTAAMGAVAFQLRSLPNLINQAVRRATIVELSITNSDPAFTWIERWLAAQPYAARAKCVTLRSYDEDGEHAYNGSSAANWALSPGDGLHWFWWRGRFIWLLRSKNSPSGSGGGSNRREVETIKLQTLGRSQSVLRAIVEDARLAARSSDIVAVRLWRGYWAPVRGKRPRDLSTIVLAEGQTERIVASLRAFLSSASDYAKRGVPWRIGCLFKGPPGTGKTSFVLALASVLKRPICVLNLGSVENDDALFAAVMDAPSDAILLIEDIDCAWAANKRKPQIVGDEEDGHSEEEAQKVTKAGLLNALDGITTPDGRIFVMTTNHPEMLDAALIRPGRADIIEDFEYLSEFDQARMAALYYNGGFRPLQTPQSPAAMQAAFLRYPDDPDTARQLLESQP